MVVFLPSLPCPSVCSLRLLLCTCHLPWLFYLPLLSIMRRYALPHLPSPMALSLHPRFPGLLVLLAFASLTPEFKPSHYPSRSRYIITSLS